ncbi:MAG TPA: hypothetical protein VM513_36885 [Kofleriaceae bacterium]|jgi:hypothetical protein|nr:hypothetical protein [Kofleriaceae bacterium]
MSAKRKWVIATACLSLLLVASTAYIALLRKRIERATRYVNAGMSSVAYVCEVTAAALKNPNARYPPILDVADACMDVPGDSELDLRRQELRDQDFGAVARRLERHMEQRLLPIWGTREPYGFDEAYLPKGFRDD